MSEVTLAILAGGEGSRMGIPKAALRVRGLPILQFLLDQYQWPGPTLLVTAVAREHPAGWQRFSREVMDPIANQGPLRGILTAMENCETAMIAVTTVDMPNVKTRHLHSLADELNRNSADGVMVERPDGTKPRIEPFPSVFRPTAEQLIRHQLEIGQRSVQSLAALSTIRLLRAPSDWTPEVWTNLNTPADFERFEQSL